MNNDMFVSPGKLLGKLSLSLQIFLHASAQISLLFYFSMIQEIFPQNQNKDLGTSLLGKTSCSSSFYEHPVFVLLHVLKISAI